MVESGAGDPKVTPGRVLVLRTPGSRLTTVQIARQVTRLKCA